MESYIFGEMIRVIRAEHQRRESLLTDREPESYDLWRSDHEAVINELCLMLMVTLRHNIERDLVWIAALAAGDEKEISHQQYEERINELRKKSRNGTEWWDWNKINEVLNLKECQEYRSYKTLKLLANSYKHDLSGEPDEKLRKWLDLPNGRYAPLPESDLFRQKLATFIGLDGSTPYCDITERFIEIASDFLQEIRSRTKVSKLKPELVLISDFAR